MAKGKKTGGRSKGTPNKKKAAEIEEVKQLFNEAGGFKKIFGLIELIEDPKDQVSMMLKTVEYILPKRKAVEHSGSIDTGQEELTLDEVKAELQRLEQLKQSENQLFEDD